MAAGYFCQGDQILVCGALRELITLAGLPGERIVAGNRDMIAPLLHHAVALKGIEHIGDESVVFGADLCSEKSGGKWKRLDSRAMPMGLEPSGEPLWQGVESAAADRNHRIAHE